MEVVRQFQVRGAYGNVTEANFDGRRVDFWAPREPTPFLLVTHDGQNIFDKRSATKGRTWELAGTATKVASELGIPAPVIIAVFHSSTPQDPFGRVKDVTPEDIFLNNFEQSTNNAGTGLPPTRSLPNDQLRGNQYLQQISQTIAPTICDYLSHKHSPEYTAMLGASMGGLASLYGMAKYPTFYQTALAFSTHWIIGGNRLVEELMEIQPDPDNHKIWMSRGTKSLDASYKPHQDYANTLAELRGYRPGKNLATPVFKNTSHNERSWGSYVNQALRFWLTK